MNRLDLPHIARLITEVGQRLGQTTLRNGRRMTVAEAAWLAALEHRPGPRAANLDPNAGGSRYEEVPRAPGDVELVEVTRADGTVKLVKLPYPPGAVELVEIPHDPVGEAAARDDPTMGAHRRLVELLDSLESDAVLLRKLLGELVPAQPNTRIIDCGLCGAPMVTAAAGKPESLTPADAAELGWCRSCYRLDRRLEPIDVRPNGQRYYANYCRWCGGFKAEHKIEPPLELLERRHRYGRVSATEIQEALAQARAQRKPKPKRKKRR